MAIQKIELGTEPHGVGGDSYRTANEKINSNFEQVGKDIGPLGRLITKNKDDVVGAINEVSDEIANPVSLAKVDNTDYSPSNQDKKGSFVETFEDVRDVFFNSNMNELRISPPAIAECNIDLMDSLNDPHRIGFTESLNDTTLVLPICKFESQSVVNPFMPAPIKSSKIIDSQICNFRLIDGIKPLHINLRGSMSVMLRVTRSTTTSVNNEHVTGYYPMTASEVSLQLNNIGDLGQENQSNIQIASTYIGDEKPFKIYSNPDLSAFFYNNENLEERIVNNPEKCLLPEIPLNFTQGKFNPFSISEELITDTTSVTSDWVLVNDETIWKLLATTSRNILSRRVQMKDHNGVISYDRTNQVTDPKTVKSDLMYLFPEAKYIRISFSSNGNLAPEDITATVAPVGPDADAYYGRWIKFSINVAKIVTLLPDRDYRFTLTMWRLNKQWMGLDSRGLKVLSGALGFNYDYSQIVKGMVNIKNSKKEL